MQTKKVIGLSLSDELLKELDVNRGLVSRSTFVEHTLMEGLRARNAKAANKKGNADSDAKSDHEMEG